MIDKITEFGFTDVHTSRDFQVPEKVVVCLRTVNAELERFRKAVPDLNFDKLGVSLDISTSYTRANAEYDPPSKIITIGASTGESISHEIGHATDDYCGWASAKIKLSSNNDMRAIMYFVIETKDFRKWRENEMMGTYLTENREVFARLFGSVRL